MIATAQPAAPLRMVACICCGEVECECDGYAVRKVDVETGEEMDYLLCLVHDRACELL